MKATQKIVLVIEIESPDRPDEVRDAVRNVLDDAFDNDYRFFYDELVSVRVATEL